MITELAVSLKDDCSLVYREIKPLLSELKQEDPSKIFDTRREARCEVTKRFVVKRKVLMTKSSYAVECNNTILFSFVFSAFINDLDVQKYPPMSSQTSISHQFETLLTYF